VAIISIYKTSQELFFVCNPLKKHVFKIFNLILEYCKTSSPLATDHHLTHYWPICSGEMKDEIGESHMSQGEKTTFVADRFGNENSALSLNGGWTQVPSGIYFDTAQITICAWVYPQQVETWSRLIDFGNGGRTDNLDVPLAFGSIPKPSFWIFTPSPIISVVSSQNLTLGEWQFLAVTFDASVSFIYINGTQVASSKNNSYTLPIDVNRTQCYIGKSYDPINNGYSHSLIDDLRFYSKALTQVEILELMNSQPVSG